MRRRVIGVAATAAVAVLSFAVFTGAGSSKPLTASLASAEKCGDLPYVAPQDPDGVLKSLPKSYLQAYSGYPLAVHKSPWANWKPKHKPPYTIGISWGGLINNFQVYTTRVLQRKLQRNKLVKKVIFLAASSNTDVPGQIQQFQSLIQQNVDLIISQPNAPEPLAAVADQAGKRGIPVVTLINSTPSLYSVNVAGNTYTTAGATAAYVLGKVLGGKGTVLENQSVPGLSIDKDTQTAWDKVLALCPNIKVAGKTVGFFSPPAVKGAVLQFLSTHPEKIDAVLETATQAPAVIQAFQQAGRPVPPVTDVGAERASLSYWSANRSKGYDTIGTIAGAGNYADAGYRVAIHMLLGHGPKVTDMVSPTLYVTNANLAKIVKPSWTLTTPGNAEVPQALLNEKFLKNLFNRYSVVK
jgi:ribose transport system substrate-binding protein